MSGLRRPSRRVTVGLLTVLAVAGVAAVAAGEALLEPDTLARASMGEPVAGGPTADAGAPSSGCPRHDGHHDAPMSWFWG